MARSAVLRVLSVSLLVALLAGCAVAKGTQFNAASLPPLKPGEARVIVFRQSPLYGSGQTFPVTLDGQNFVKLPQSGFAWRDVPAGKHELEASAFSYAGTARLGGELQ